MNIWEILGINPTKNIKEIKVAYAHQAKKWHPEEYPEEFQKLQRAYKMALQMAESSYVIAPTMEAALQEPKIEVEPTPFTLSIQVEDVLQTSVDFDFSEVEKLPEPEDVEEQPWKTLPEDVQPVDARHEEQEEKPKKPVILFEFKINIRKIRKIGIRVLAIAVILLIVVGPFAVWRNVFYRFYDDVLKNYQMEYEMNDLVDEEQISVEFEELLQEYEKRNPTP